MKLHQQNTPDVNTIRAFEPGRIRINDDYYEKSLLVTADAVQANWDIVSPAQLTADSITALLCYQTEIILIGTGEQHQLLDPRLYLEAMQQGIGVEVMTTEAACHTYNILLGEDRNVLAALIIERN